MKSLVFTVRKDTYFPFGFQVSKKAWDANGLSDVLSSPAMAAPPSLTYTMRVLADRLNQHRDAHTYRTSPLHAGQLMSFGLITEVLRHLADKYCTDVQPGALRNAMDTVRQGAGAHIVEQPHRTFVHLYPPQTVRDGVETESDYLVEAAVPKPNRYLLGLEMVLFSVTCANPALAPFRDLFWDEDLPRHSPYEPLVDHVERFFKGQPPFPGFTQTLFDFLRLPAKASPESLDGQIEYILEHWAHLLPAALLERLRLAADVLKEEAQLRGHGPGPNLVLQFGPEYLLDWGYPEPACFTHDRDWMSNVVLIAKSIYVWLYQLSRRYGRSITRLDQIPDEELDRLARWGFTGLWLIGLWERSPASRRIKQMTGNPEALSSAYSLYDYQIAHNLGGESAYKSLFDRAFQRGIRLASDMVPNHVGLYSKWVIEHPDWFLQLDYPPFPGYRFTDPDLSEDSRVGLYIEEGYWSQRDAAVVFKRVDRQTGQERYIYHGNDGTNMPWNDTAQLNFLIPEVREAVIQAILHVARMFPILRFDAAMTLTKRHYQRLWFPKPGDAGAVPSRAEHGMSRAEFDAVFPKEFWREVVDRIQREVPDTLLIAEAFWLMEGYFVRTLGMHRVYNSAFMNMLKMEENSKYRDTIKNVLEFSPEVLKRFVNFMNNPDERTAVDQFGKDDKYFGVAVLMVTMPGLPMFGHGQIEGFTEKYGMEYARSYWDESVDEHMVRRHEMEIFPLMRKRHLFSGSEHFALYDCVTDEGWVDENVFAYSNRAGVERAIILYNNAYRTATGRIHLSTAINVGDADNKDLRRVTLADALALDVHRDRFCVFRDHRSGLEYIRSTEDLAQNGLQVCLGAYQYNAFLDFREIHDIDGTWRRLCHSLQGGGVPSIFDAYQEQTLAPIRTPFRQVMCAEMLRALVSEGVAPTYPKLQKAMKDFMAVVSRHMSVECDTENVLRLLKAELDAIEQLPAQLRRLRLPKAASSQLLGAIPKKAPHSLSFWRIPVALALTHSVLKARAATDYSAHATTDVDQWLLSKIVAEAFLELDGAEVLARNDALLVRILSAYPTVLDFVPESGGIFTIRRMFEDAGVQKYLGMNYFENAVWFNKEQFERLIYWLLLESCINLLAEGGLSKEALTLRLEIAQRLQDAAHQSNYRVESFLGLLSQEKSPEDGETA